MERNSAKKPAVHFPQTENMKKREKQLTAKYPQRQMQLIRKRLKVEFWLDDQLKFLYESSDQNDNPDDLIDSLLDLNTDSQRRLFLLEKFSDVKQSQSITTNIIEELIHRIKTL